ncbi:MAG: uroporphyrinogen-III synthase, partial [Verrucomicrobia bacterium]|nr:uroporphyrinogen-III synthase [Verrucomicrobiota bacterium]
AISIVGEVVALSEKLNWFGRRPLCGKRIVVTRAQEAAPPASISAPSFSDKLSELGADVLEIPAIKIAGPSRRQDIVDALLSLNSYDWLVFTSARGVTVFFDLFFKHFHDLRDLGGAKIAAVGPATAACLQTFHLQVDVMPGEFVGRKIAGAMAAHQSIENSKVCLLRAEVANPELPRALEEFGAIVDDVGLYQTLAETRAADGVVDHFLAHGADWLTFTSASTVEFFHRRFDLPKLRQKFPRMKIATIGPETSKSARALKIEPDVEALEHTTDGLLAALVAASGKR